MSDELGLTTVGQVQELRRDFHDRLTTLQDGVAAMVAQVTLAVRSATEAFLADDADAARRVADADGIVDHAAVAAEREVFDLVALQSPVARDLRFLIATLRISQEVERCGDLAVSVAHRGGQIGPGMLTGEVRSMLDELGSRAARMLEGARAAYRVLDVALARAVMVQDDDLDARHHDLLAALFAMNDAPAEGLIELAMVGRFYARIGDHAYAVAQRVCFIVDGELGLDEAGRRDPP